MESRSSRQMAELLDLVAELQRRKGYVVGPHGSAVEWLIGECRLDRRTAQERVRVAQRLADWRRVWQALAKGLLSYSQVRAITRADASENEEELLQLALGMTGAELERHVKQMRSSPSADPEVARAAHNRRTLKWFPWRDDGSISFYGRLPAEEGQLFVEAVETAAAALVGDPAGNFVDVETGEILDQRPPIGALRADALAEIMRSGAPRMTLVLHADTAALADAADERRGEVCFLEDGAAIPSELARRLVCDCDIRLADKLNLGRTQRVISLGQRRALEHRDGRVCAMPGCTRTHGLDGHHLKAWIHGGTTDLDNLVLLCREHHRRVHEGGWQLSREPGGEVIIRTGDGREIRHLPARASPQVAVAA